MPHVRASDRREMIVRMPAGADARTSRARRYREIVDVLSVHGFGYLLGATGMAGRFPFQRGLPGHEAGRTYTQAEHLRLAFEQLGPAFIKLGQVISTRPDLLPAHYLDELATLQDAASPVLPDDVLATVAEELGATPGLYNFETVPLAAGSIGTVHTATVDGGEVVVKVRRTGAVESVRADLDILADLAQRACRRSQLARDYDVVAVAAEFAQTLNNELDYLAEGRNAERFARNFADDGGVVFPKVMWGQTTSRVLTLERIRGIRIGETEALDAAGVDRHEVATLAARTLCKMVFEDGFFHADPHPGNFFVLDGGRLGIIDFGMVGELDDDLRQRLIRLFAALITRSPDHVAAALIDLTTASTAVDRAALRDDVAPFVDRFAGLPLNDLPIGELVSGVNAILRRHRLRRPRHVALLLKTLVMAEGMGRQLDPGFRFAHVMAPFADRLLARPLTREQLVRRLLTWSGSLTRLSADTPQALRDVIGALDGTSVRVRLSEADLLAIVTSIRDTGDRLIAALLAAAALQAMDRRHRRRPDCAEARGKSLILAGLAVIASHRALYAHHSSNADPRGPVRMRFSRPRHRPSEQMHVKP